MAEYKVKRIHNGKSEYITAMVGNLQWSDSLDSLGMEFSFDIPHSYWDDQFKERLYNGDTIVIYRDSTELLRGIITNVPINGATYSGYDYAFYLNKSKTVIQFNKISASTAIRKLCDRYNVPIGEMPKLSTSINKVYKGQTVSDILLDILEQVKNETGQEYRMEMWKGKLSIIKSGEIKVKPTYTPIGGSEVSCTKSAEITGTRNSEELKNKIIVAGSGEDQMQIKATAKSEASIKKYGLLSDVETREKLDDAKARNIAKNKLKELNKVSISFTAEMVGNISVRSGRALYFDRPEVGIKGWFKVKSCVHTINNHQHRMSCEMEG